MNGGTLGLTSLQGAYNYSGAPPHIQLDSTRQGLTLRDASTPIGTVLRCESFAGDDFFTMAPLLSNILGTPTRRGFELSDEATATPSLRVMPDNRTKTTVPTWSFALAWDTVLTSNVAGGGAIGNDAALGAVGWTGEVILADPGNLFSTALLFNQATIVTCAPGRAGPLYTMVNQPLLRADGVSTTGSQANAVRSQMRVGPNLNGGSITLASHEPFYAFCTVDGTVGSASITAINYFAAKAPSLVAGGTIGTLHCLDIPNIPAAGITNLRGIASAMSSGQFIRHTGTAPAQFGGSIQLGSGTTFDVDLSRGAANRLDLASGDAMRIISGSLQFVDTGGQIASSVSGELQVTSTRLGFGIAPSGANWAFGFNATARTITVAGDFANCLNTTGGNHTINAAMSTFTQWTINAPAGTIGTGSVADAANLLVQTSVAIGTNRYGVLITSNPSGGTENAALCVRNGFTLTQGGLVVEVTNDGGRGAAGTAGRVIFNTTDGNLNIDDGTNWILPDGTTT